MGTNNYSDAFKRATPPMPDFVKRQNFGVEGVGLLSNLHLEIVGQMHNAVTVTNRTGLNPDLDCTLVKHNFNASK